MWISVIGGSTATAATREQARQVGALLAERGHTLVCGGLGGVMDCLPGWVGGRWTHNRQPPRRASWGGEPVRRDGYRHRAGKRAQRPRRSER